MLGILLTIAVAGGALAVYSFNRSGKFRVVGGSPSNKSTNVPPENTITLVFSQDLDTNQAQTFLQTSPSQLFVMELQKNKLVLTPAKPLQEKSQYLISINNIRSTQGQQTSTSILFTTGVNNSPRAQFIRLLPFSGSDFNIFYNENLDGFTVQISTKSMDQAKAQALQYFRDNNVDPNKQRIDFQQLRYLQGKGAPPPN